MKKAIKVLNTITIIYYLIIGMIYICFSTSGHPLDKIFLPIIPFTFEISVDMILFYILFIIPIIILAIANYKLDYADCKNELAVISTITLVFANFISGILMICMNENELK